MHPSLRSIAQDLLCSCKCYDCGLVNPYVVTCALLFFPRKKKAVHKTTTTDDKRLQNTLKRLGVNTIPGIEEVNIFKDETVIHFVNPKGMLFEFLCSGLTSSLALAG